MKLILSKFIEYIADDEEVISSILHDITKIEKIAHCAFKVTTTDGTFYVPVFMDGHNKGKIAAITSTEEDPKQRIRFYDANKRG